MKGIFGLIQKATTARLLEWKKVEVEGKETVFRTRSNGFQLEVMERKHRWKGWLGMQHEGDEYAVIIKDNGRMKVWTTNAKVIPGEETKGNWISDLDFPLLFMHIQKETEDGDVVSSLRHHLARAIYTSSS